MSKIHRSQVGPEAFEALWAEAVRAIESGDNRRAIEVLRRAVMADPNRVEAHQALGAMLLPMLEIDEAEHHCREVIRLGGATHYTYLNLAIALGNNCELEEARAMALQAQSNSSDEYILDMANQLIKDIDNKTYLGGPWMCKLDTSKYKNTRVHPVDGDE